MYTKYHLLVLISNEMSQSDDYSGIHIRNRLVVPDDLRVTIWHGRLR